MEPLVQHCSMKTWNTPLAEPDDPKLPPIVALGKFDAMHKGHRALCMQVNNTSSPLHTEQRLAL